MCATKRKEMAVRRTRISVGLPSPRIGLAQWWSKLKKSPRLKRIPAWRAEINMASSSASAYILQHDTQAVGRSGCFLFHSDSVARIRLLPNSTSGMLYSSLTVCTIDLSLFETKEAAAVAYNKAARRYFGDFARLNPLITYRESFKTISGGVFWIRAHQNS